MQSEFRYFETLGTPNYFLEMASLISNNEKVWRDMDIRKYFHNRVIDGEFIFDGCLLFAEELKIIERKGGCILLSSMFSSCLSDRNHFMFLIIKALFELLKKDSSFDEIFCYRNISYNTTYRCIQVKNNAFRFKYANIKKFLLCFGFLKRHPGNNLSELIVNKKYHSFFNENILPEIRIRKFGMKELKGLISQKEVYGEEAEKFSLIFEKKRLSGHRKINSIQIISEYDVCAGYDIISYNSIDSTYLDRFIEVKSFSDFPKFYWSRNEIDVAYIRQGSYYLYLIDRKKIMNIDYTPIIINNPYENIIKNNTDWSKRIEEYYIVNNNTINDLGS